MLHDLRCDKIGTTMGRCKQMNVDTTSGFVSSVDPSNTKYPWNMKMFWRSAFEACGKTENSAELSFVFLLKRLSSIHYLTYLWLRVIVCPLGAVWAYYI